MRCDEAGELIGAYFDQELEADARREVAAHLGGCAACVALGDDMRRVSRQVAALERERAPQDLAADVRALLAVADSAPAPRVAMPHGLLRQGWLRQAAVLLLACGVTAAVTGLLVSRSSGIALIERDVAAAHVRSLLQDSPMQIASSDNHTVKPWFAGRLEFSPAVRDLSAEGFPLAGARLDYIGGRRVAALVYRRRLHVVNVFLWPSAGGVETAAHESSVRGYNVISWKKEGIAYWAISDLNMAELRELQARL
jgi:anti-sigma factor RsiW